MEDALLLVGDPEKDMCEFLERDITAEDVQREMKRMKDKLARTEEERTILLAAPSRMQMCG